MWILSASTTSATTVPHSHSQYQVTSRLIEWGILVLPQSRSQCQNLLCKLDNCRTARIVLLKSKVTVTRILIFETWDSVLDSWNFGESSLELPKSILEFRELRVESRNIMSLSLDWSLEEQIHQTDHTMLLQTMSNGFCNPCYSCDKTKVALLKHICAEKMSWLTKFPACTGLLKQKSKLLVVGPWLKITTDW